MAWDLLLESGMGLASLGVIVATVVIGFGFIKFFEKMAKDQALQASK